MYFQEYVILSRQPKAPRLFSFLQMLFIFFHFGLMKHASAKVMDLGAKDPWVHPEGSHKSDTQPGGTADHGPSFPGQQ